MRYVIDTDLIQQRNYTEAEVLGVMFLTACNRGYQEEFLSMQSKGMLDMFGNPTMSAVENVQNILLDADSSVPSEDRLEKLYESMREYFPRGYKVAPYAWRGNKKDVTLKLKKFFKLYGNKYTDEQILDATRRYVECFNGNNTHMRILKYFILKDNESDLATVLENEDDNLTNLFAEIR